MIKKYKSIYENYEFDSGSDDRRDKEVIVHNSLDDYEDAVNEIRITDIRYEDEDYLNLNREFGGNPRLSSKSGNFSAFAENQHNQSLGVNRRTSTVNGKTEVIYTPKNPGSMLRWINGKIECSSSFCNDSESRNIVFNNKYTVLVISAKSLKLGDQRDKIRQAKAKEIRKVGKMKYTNGGNVGKHTP
jgi:hypothetical protein